MHIKYALDGYREHFKKHPLEKQKMTEDQIKHMADRFLAWKLPETFHPDNGISFDRTIPHPGCPPVGTNLFSADEAKDMVRHMLGGADEATLGDMLSIATGDYDTIKDYAWRAAAMLRFLRANEGECIGDHPDWVKRIDNLLSEQSE